MANNGSKTTAETLTEYRKALVEGEFTEDEIRSLVIEGARDLIHKGGLKV